MCGGRAYMATWHLSLFNTITRIQRNKKHIRQHLVCFLSLLGVLYGVDLVEFCFSHHTVSCIAINSLWNRLNLNEFFNSDQRKMHQMTLLLTATIIIIADFVIVSFFSSFRFQIYFSKLIYYRVYRFYMQNIFKIEKTRLKRVEYGMRMKMQAILAWFEQNTHETHNFPNITFFVRWSIWNMKHNSLFILSGAIINTFMWLIFAKEILQLQ